ncbi:GNAT family N-acetyltransferase [Kineococcus gynurae]|uniref:GNAT family N-acetyltransferase n=1 Tax=Kineococcus gynurae TaxID=452979 RepID=A0ABV5LRK4_9ACTN
MPSAAPPDPLDRVPWPLRTPRLTVARATPADEDEVWAYRRRDDVGEWLGLHPVDRADFHEIFSSRLGTGLVVRRDGDLVGDLMLKIGDGWGQREVVADARGTQAELGWVLDPAATGHGYAEEALRAVITCCFTRLGLRRIVAHAFADNLRSRRLMDRLGLRLESHTVAESLHRDHGWVDGVGYALLATEWSLPPATDESGP